MELNTIKYPWEDEENEGNYPPSCIDSETMRKHVLIANTFLHQVRTTGGYSVTCRFKLHECPFMQVTERDRSVKKAMPLALSHISQKTGKAYELVKIENAVVTKNWMVLLTFDAKCELSVPETFISMVRLRPGGVGVEECLLKPDHGADWGANEDKVLLRYDRHDI